MFRIGIIVILIVAIAIGTVLVTSGRFQLAPKASEEKLGQFPQNVVITNVTDKSLTISYFTPKKPVQTKVSYGKGGNTDKTQYDDRGDAVIPRYTHHVTLKGLEANTEYTVKIEAVHEGYPENNLVKVKTAGPVSSPEGDSSGDGIIFKGAAKSTTGVGSEDGIVYLKVENGQYLSTYLSKNGRWQIPLIDYRNDGLGEIEELDIFDEVDILAVAGIEGYGYYGTLLMDRDNSITIVLGEHRLPLFKVQFPGNTDDSDDKSGKSSASSSEKRSGGGIGAFFGIIWSYISGIFN